MGVNSPIFYQIEFKMIAKALIVKVASRCNLNCTYCYMYNMGDDSYKLQPKYMSLDTVKDMFSRLSDHCNKYNLVRFLIVFHGGEPLLCDVDFYKKFMQIAKETISKNIKMSYAMQTNGILLTHELAQELKLLEIQVGISLDGTEISNNKNRIYHNGKGSYNEILRGFEIIKNTFGKEYANCLCVINTDEKPDIVYSHFKKIGASNVHFLFQDFNYLTASTDTVPPVGNWLSEMYDVWFNDEDPNKPSLRPLTDLVSLMFEFTRFSEIFGKGYNDVLVIETNGSIETVDTLKICGDSFTKTTFHVRSNNLDDIYSNSKLAKLYYNAHHQLSKKCQNCPVESICGGGFLGHRFSNENEFDNPSVYCKEIVKIISHIQNRVIENLSDETLIKNNIQKLDSKEIIEYLYDEIKI